MLKIDYTVFIQIANFLFLLLILNLILYRPIRNIIRKRRAEMESLEAGISNLEGKAAEHSHLLEESMALVRREGSEQKENIRHAGLEEEKGMMRDASARAGDKINEARKQMEDKINAARQALQREVATFSKELAEKILGRSV
jgi:F-type H+-transporting ATPase subunit b